MIANLQLIAEGESLKAKEVDLRLQVELLRLDIQAFGAALREFGLKRQSNDASPVRGCKQPGNVYDRTLLVETYSKGVLGESFLPYQ